MDFPVNWMFNMTDKMKKLAELLVTYSVNILPGENVLIEAHNIPNQMVRILITEITLAGGNAFVNTFDSRIVRELVMSATEESIQLEAEFDLAFMKKMDAYIALRGDNNSCEWSDVPAEQMAMYRRIRRPITDYRVSNTKWCVLRWPTYSMAQSANMSTDAFEKFFFDVCTINYSKMASAAEKLVSYMNNTDRVSIYGNQTLLEFSIKGIPAVACTGNYNIPDGEVYTAPIKDSVNGIIRFNTETIYDGKKFSDIILEFKDGKIINASSSSGDDILNNILDVDDGARFIGEFALGFNPLITNAMCDILFDEKIAGSFHFTPGQAYENADNGNRSIIHWDMVMNQSPEYGGGEIYFDGVLIRKDGLFVVDELKALNPIELMGD